MAAEPDEIDAVTSNTVEHQAKSTNKTKSVGGTSTQQGNDLTDTSAWEKRNLLSLDGGGIRGYWSLLMLRQLMIYIGIEEESLRNEASDHFEGFHSFWPERWLDNVSHVAPKGKGNSGTGRDNPAAHCRALDRSQRYLPCHYFDYICGSSTGALIAIMIGRLRMTITDCLDEYERLGQEIFGHPRRLRSLNTLGVINLPKYRASKVKAVFESVARNRCEQVDELNNIVDFPSKDNTCRTFVTTKLTSPEDKSIFQVFLIRSYAHYESTFQTKPLSNSQTWKTVRTDTGRTNSNIPSGEGTRLGLRRVNYGPASTLPIWAVARAAAAAPFYFKPLTWRFDDCEVQFSDGGFGTTNNPTKEGTREINGVHGRNKVGVVVSIGTARADKVAGPGLKDQIELIADRATNPETVHHDIEQQSEEQGYTYYRLNDPGAINIPLDQWEPRGFFARGKSSGSKTLKELRGHFNDWIATPENHLMLQECAKDLVTRRRRRTTDKALWERFAIVSEFTCPKDDCRSQQPYITRDKLKEHLVSEHADLEEEDVTDSFITDHRRRWEYRPKKNPS